MRSFNKKKKDKKVKPNLIPILDAVFIFIFFLLISAQFIDVYEINSDAPAVVTIDRKIDKKKPLNLVLEIRTSRIVIKTGLSEDTFKTIGKNNSGKYDLVKLGEVLMNLKVKNIDEKSVILRPVSIVPYSDIVRIMDVARAAKGNKIIQGKNKKGELVKTVNMFDQIIFETII
ncbi:MAG: biopolymer transporter ExbD [Bacteriovoracaceae bacterium]|nr:biopolymer transporter ExbD [Bacteriovoracaceae bacterium]